MAQATLTPWTPAGKGKHLTPDEFRDAMNDTPGWEPVKELQAGKAQSADDRWMYRISEVGKMDDIEVLQNFYLVAAPGGEQVVVAVTLTPKQAEKLGARDPRWSAASKYRWTRNNRVFSRGSQNRGSANRG